MSIKKSGCRHTINRACFRGNYQMSHWNCNIDGIIAKWGPIWESYGIDINNPRSINKFHFEPGYHYGDPVWEAVRAFREVKNIRRHGKDKKIRKGCNVKVRRMNRNVIEEELLEAI